MGNYVKPRLVASWSDGEVLVSINTVLYRYRVDAAILPTLRRKWKTKPWWVVNTYLRGREIGDESRVVTSRRDEE